MLNPLQIPEIIGKVVEHLDTQSLAAVSAVNKIWRLEARRKLYQNRRTIIYDFFLRGWLDVPRRYHLIGQNLLNYEPARYYIARLMKFSYAFNLDFKNEFLLIKKKFRKEDSRAKRLYDKLGAEVREKRNLIESYIPESEDFWKAVDEWDNALEKHFKVDKQCFEVYRDMVNFEYFLSSFGGGAYLTNQEFYSTFNKLSILEEWEEKSGLI